MRRRIRKFAHKEQSNREQRTVQKLRPLYSSVDRRGSGPIRENVKTEDSLASGTDSTAGRAARYNTYTSSYILYVLNTYSHHHHDKRTGTWKQDRSPDPYVGS